MPTNLSHINSIELLKREQFVVKERIKKREEDLRKKMYEIPAELAAAGVNSFIPKILRGKITDTALNGGKMLINKFMVPDENGTGMIHNVSKGVGLFNNIKKAFSLFRKFK